MRLMSPNKDETGIEMFAVYAGLARKKNLGGVAFKSSNLNFIFAPMGYIARLSVS